MTEGDRTRVGDVYDEHYDLLFGVAVRKFQVPAEDVPVLINDVMLSYIVARDEVENIEQWLVAAICNAARYYHRRARREPTAMLEEEPQQKDTAEERLINRIDAGRVLDRVPRQHRRVLHWHYLEGYTAPEIARLLETTPRYAERLIHKALRYAGRTG